MDALCQDVSAVSLAARLRLALPARTEDCLPAAASPTPPTVHRILTEESDLLQGRVSWAKVSCVLIIFSSFYTKGDSSAQGDLFSVGTFFDDTIQWCLSGSASCCCCTWPCCCCWAGRPRQLGYGRRPAGLGLAWTCRRRSWSRCSGVSRWEWWALSITPCSWSRGTNSTWRARPAHGPRPTGRPASRSTCSACRPGPTGESRCITQGAGFCMSFGLILFVFWLIEQEKNESADFLLPGSPTTPPGIPATSRRRTACVRAAWSARTVRRASCTAALRSTLRPSSWGEPAPASAADTPTRRSTCPSRWGAPVCRCWRRSGTAGPATRAWREWGPKPASALQETKYEGSRAVDLYTGSTFLSLYLSPLTL